MVVIQLPPEYGYVLLAAVIYSCQCMVVGLGGPGLTRGKVFTEEYMKKHFGEEHQKVFGEEIPVGGYPDTGNGYYSKHLTYEEWYKFNNGQRAHMNFVEMVASTLVFLLVAGIYFPIPSASVGLVMIIARIIYTCGYTMAGPRGRNVGAIINDLAFLALFVLSFISSIYFILNQQI